MSLKWKENGNTPFAFITYEMKIRFDLLYLDLRSNTYNELNIAMFSVQPSTGELCQDFVEKFGRCRDYRTHRYVNLFLLWI